MKKTLNELEASVTRAEGISSLMELFCDRAAAGMKTMEPYTAAMYLIGELAKENAEKLNAVKDRLIELTESEVKR